MRTAHPPKTTLQLTNLFRVMVELIDDKPVREVTKDDMRSLYRLLPQFPSHAPKRYPGFTAVDAIAAADADSSDERLSPKTQNDYFTHRMLYTGLRTEEAALPRRG